MLFRSLAELRAAGLDPGTVPARNVYGWFRRESRGRYGLSEAGTLALRHSLATGKAPVLQTGE